MTDETPLPSELELIELCLLEQSRRITAWSGIRVLGMVSRINGADVRGIIVHERDGTEWRQERYRLTDEQADRLLSTIVIEP